ncbi:type II secretion system inner membrane protein GspF [bacterium]|nr:type II secretion system inner membrane protein GspF [candidate division CSSED10-310 bacterium]
MAKFTYRAADQNGKHQTGIMEAPNEAYVIAKIREQNLRPLNISKSEEKANRFTSEIHLGKIFQRVARRDVMDFTAKLSTLADAGVQLDRCLAISSELTENDKMRDIIKEVRRNVQGGSSFADALGRHPKVFSRLYVNMIRSGEAGGVLESILQRLSGFLESSQELREEIVSASVYPILLIIVGALVVGLMVTFVLPKFTVIFENMGADLPLATRILVDFVDFFKRSWFFVIGGLLLVYFAINQYLKTDEGRLKWDKFKLKMPVAGQLIQKIEIARFARTLGTLVRSGVPILQALSIVKDTLTNEVIASSLLNVYSRLKEGGGLATPLKETGCFPALAVHMIAVGEETGSFEAMLLKVADTYERDVKIAIQRAMSLVEPLLIIVMGLVVGFVVFAMLLAVFSISDMPL